MSKPSTKPGRAFFEVAPAEDLFVREQRQAKLLDYVGALAGIDELFDFEAMAAKLDEVCPSADRSKGGRPPYATQVLVRMVVLQGLYKLSDEQCEYQVLDRMSFQRFCRLDGSLSVPDARTLWRFKQRLADKGLGGQAIFEEVGRELQRRGYIARGGQMVDATIVQAPITHVTSQEHEVINRGDKPEGWSKKRVAHTDLDARWTIKHGKAYYGYKLHANADAKYKLIRRIQVTPANADDGHQLKHVLDKNNTRAWMLADRGYDSAANRELLDEHALQDGIARRAKPGQSARKRLEQRNRTISTVRSRVEHVFAGLAQQGRKVVRAVTLARNSLAMHIKCAVYNARRLVWLERQQELV